MKAKVAIIGAGVNGLGLAYQLARHHDIDDVVVVERRYPMYGGSGRNGGGIRAQWGTLANLELAARSIPMFQRLGPALGLHMWFRQGGYLMMVRRSSAMPDLRRRASFQRSHGVPTHVVGPNEAKRLAPCVNVDDIAGAAYCPNDAVIFPWPVVNGYLEQSKARGVRVLTRTAVTGIHRDGDRVTGLSTTAGDIEAEWVVNAAGGWSHEVAAMAGVETPNRPVRHEILVTESLRPFVEPMVVDLDNGLYASQDARGEIVAGLGNPEEPVGVTMSSSYGFLRRLSTALVHRIPALANVHVLRQWAGCYDMSPDHVPIIGPAGDVSNFLLCCGFSGHGFMVSPAVTECLAAVIAGREPPVDLHPYRLERFAQGDTIPESLVIG